MKKQVSLNNKRRVVTRKSEMRLLLTLNRKIRDCLYIIKQQKQGKKLQLGWLCALVANKLKELSDARSSVPTILDYYDRLNGYDAQITALVSSICGCEPFVRGACWVLFRLWLTSSKRRKVLGHQRGNNRCISTVQRPRY